MLSCPEAASRLGECLASNAGAFYQLAWAAVTQDSVQCVHCGKWRLLPASVDAGALQADDWNCEMNVKDAARARCSAPAQVESDYAAGHEDVDVVEAPTPAAFRDDVAEAVRVECAAGAFVVLRQRAMRVVLLKKPRLPPGYKGERAWHLFAVGCPPADENPLKLQHCFVLVSLPAEVCFYARFGGAMRPGGSTRGLLSSIPSSARRGTKTPSATVPSP